VESLTPLFTPTLFLPPAWIGSRSPYSRLLFLDPPCSGEVGPIFPTLDIADGGMIDSVMFGDLSRKPVVIEYVEYLFFRQLCATVCRPFTTSAPDDPIQDVILMGARLQMPRVHAGRVIAAMSNYEPLGDPAMKVLVAEAVRGEVMLGHGE